MADDFLTKVQAQLRELRAQDDQLAATEEGIRRKRAELSARLAAFEQSLSVYREVMGEAKEAKPAAVLFEEHEPQGSIAEMAQRYIVNSGGRARVKDIAEELRRAGKLKQDSRLAYATVYSILRRDKRFQSVGEATFTLARHPSAPALPSERSLAAAQE